LGRAVGDNFSHVREEITGGNTVGDHFVHVREEITFEEQLGTILPMLEKK
jgi:hypothetical protein